jgi:glycerate kinase
MVEGCPTVIPHRLLVAPDAFSGTLSSTQVAAAIARGLESAGLPPPDLCPLADGGEGILAVLLVALGGTTAAARVSDPLGRCIRAGFGLLEDGNVAVVEMAQASGLGLVAEGERDAEAASSAGTGQLIAAAARTGAAVILVGAGASAATDGGRGAIDAIKRAGGLRDARLVVLCDVRTAFEDSAAHLGARQGADPAAVRRLRTRLARLASRLPRDPRGIPMTGAGGGLAGGLWAAFGARLEPGSAFVLDAVDFDTRLRRARAVVVGEGRLDHSTLEGKAVFEISTRARQIGVPAHAIVGHNAMDRFDARILDLQAILEGGDEAALERAGRALAELCDPTAVIERT